MDWSRWCRRRSEAEPVRVTLYMRPGCCLCDAARDEILDLAERIPLVLEERDITADVELYERYRYTIPVVAINGREALFTDVDAKRLEAALRRR